MADRNTLRPAPLLNEYKYGILRRRLLQVLTGGVRVSKTPWFVHLIQFCLWISPLLVCIPFIIVDSLKLWSSCYVSLVYAVSMGIYSLLLEIFVTIVRCQKDGWKTFTTARNQPNDEEQPAFSSCLKQATVHFIFGQKRLHSLLMHPFMVGLLSFSGCFLLLPSVMLESLHIAGLVLVFIIGWYTQCCAHYSLSVNECSSEVALYRLTDPLELKYLMRPFYVVLVATFFVAIRYMLLFADSITYLQVLYTALCLLPIGWTIGILPPLDGLWVWFMEQVHTRLLGGSVMGTELRLFVMFHLSICSVVVVSVISNDTLKVLLATVFGFILSQDVFSLLKVFVCGLFLMCPSQPRFLESLCDQRSDKVFLSLTGIDFRKADNYKIVFIYTMLIMFKGAIILSISMVILYFTFNATDATSNLASSILSGLVLASFIIFKASDALQTIYIFGMFRNPLFPWKCDNVSKFKSRRKLLHYFSVPRTIASNYLLSLLLFAFVGHGLGSEVKFVPSFWLGISLSRMLRKVWQSPAIAHLELAVAALLSFIIPSNTPWSMIGLTTQAFIIEVLYEIVNEFLQKLFFATTIFFSFIALRKQRTYTFLSVLIITGTLFLLPLIMVVMLLSSVLSVPLLPLFTLPVFTFSFPRPKKFWPGLTDYGEHYTKCADSVFYQQCQTEMVRVILTSMTARSISSQPGTQLLVRFDDRIIICSILEAGFGFRTVLLKGLELQETSCHTVEASKIDDTFETVYYNTSKRCQFFFNTEIINTLLPKDSAVIKTYSDAKNVLTGIIDQSNNLNKFSSNLIRTLTWVFFHHFKGSMLSESYDRTTSMSVAKEPKQDDDIHVDNLSNHNEAKHPSSVYSVKKNSEADKFSDDFSWTDSTSTVEGDSQMVVIPLNSVKFLKDDLVPEDVPITSTSNCKNSKCNYSGKAENIFVSSKHRSPTIHGSGQTVSNDVVCQGPIGVSIKVHPEMYVSQACTEIPKRWSMAPLPSEFINRIGRQFPDDWLTFIKKNPNQQSVYLSSDQEQQLIALVIVCFSLVDVPTVSLFECNERKTNAFDIYQGFMGEFPHSMKLSWLTEDSQLLKMALKAYRYAVKLMYDEVSLGEIEDHLELAKYLGSYDNEFFIGCESENEWEQSILNQVPNLFSISRDQNEDVYRAHILTLQDQLVHIGVMNTEAMKAVWSDLSLELLFFTNDDEERYSIQAHPYILRNLTIQTADQPLGYCIYSSGLVVVTGL